MSITTKKQKNCCLLLSNEFISCMLNNLFSKGKIYLQVGSESSKCAMDLSLTSQSSLGQSCCIYNQRLNHQFFVVKYRLTTSEYDMWQNDLFYVYKSNFKTIKHIIIIRLKFKHINHFSLYNKWNLKA